MSISGKKEAYQQYPKFHIAVDAIIFGFDRGDLKLLLHRRQFAPFKGEWSLFGGFVKEGESLDSAANRVLFDLSGIEQVYMEEVQAYGDVGRDPAGRVISVAYYALIPADAYREATSSHGAEWLSIKELPELILDHRRMVEKALRRLRRRAASQPIGFELLPKKFTLPQLNALYEAIYQQNIDKRNFRKKLLAMNVLIKSEEKDKSGSRKGAFLYKFDRKKYEEMVNEGLDFAL